MNRFLDTVSRWTLCNYFLLLSITQLVRIIGYETKFEVLLLLASIIVLLIHKADIKSSGFNVFFFLLMLYIICTALLNEYRVELKYYSFRYFIWSMLFFFIGQLKAFANGELFRSQKYVLLMLYVISLYLYFMPPSWYQVWKNAAFTSFAHYEVDITNYNDDFSRLSGFWSYPYFVSYSTVIYIYYFLLRYRLNLDNKFTLLCLLTAFCTAFFAMMRVVIVGVIAYYLILQYLFPVKKNQNWILLNKALIIAVLLGISYSTFFLNDYIIDRITNNDSVVSSRIMIFSTLFKNINIFGYGIGRFSNEAKLYGGASIMDSEWLKLLCEIGIVGTLLLLSFFIVILIKGFKNWHNNILELGIIIFFLISMIGANSLEQPIVKHSIFMWFCAGQIINRYRKTLQPR